MAQAHSSDLLGIGQYITHDISRVRYEITLEALCDYSHRNRSRTTPDTSLALHTVRVNYGQVLDIDIYLAFTLELDISGSGQRRRYK